MYTILFIYNKKISFQFEFVNKKRYLTKRIYPLKSEFDLIKRKMSSQKFQSLFSNEADQIASVIRVCLNKKSFISTIVTHYLQTQKV